MKRDGKARVEAGLKGLEAMVEGGMKEPEVI